MKRIGDWLVVVAVVVNTTIAFDCSNKLTGDIVGVLRNGQFITRSEFVSPPAPGLSVALYVRP